jgi:hypothetical protein
MPVQKSASHYGFSTDGYWHLCQGLSGTRKPSQIPMPLGQRKLMPVRNCEVCMQLRRLHHSYPPENIFQRSFVGILPGAIVLQQ